MKPVLHSQGWHPPRPRDACDVYSQFNFRKSWHTDQRLPEAEVMMGQAKNRGSFEERKTAATQQNPVLGLIERGDAPHYAFILDHSDTGKQLLENIRWGPQELKSRLDSPSFQMWDVTAFQFLILWGSWGYSGGLTIPVRDIDFLCNEGLPVVVKRTAEKGGLCTFVLGIEPVLQERVNAKLAELQPAEGGRQ